MQGWAIKGSLGPLWLDEKGWGICVFFTSGCRCCDKTFWFQLIPFHLFTFDCNKKLFMVFWFKGMVLSSLDSEPTTQHAGVVSYLPIKVCTHVRCTAGDWNRMISECDVHSNKSWWWRKGASGTDHRQQSCERHFKSTIVCTWFIFGGLGARLVPMATMQ